MNWSEFSDAVRDARNTLQLADDAVRDLGGLLPGRLHKVSTYDLRRIKRELRDFDMVTGKWKEDR
jgi:hypothetical protein